MTDEQRDAVDLLVDELGQFPFRGHQALQRWRHRGRAIKELLGLGKAPRRRPDKRIGPPWATEGEVTHDPAMVWAMMKRGYHGIYHRLSPKHLNRYVDEFSGLLGKVLRYRDLIRSNGRPSGAREIAP